MAFQGCFRPGNRPMTQSIAPLRPVRRQAGAWLAARFGGLRRSMHWLDRLAGALFVSFGLKLAISDNPVS